MRERRRFVRITESLKLSYEVMSQAMVRDSLTKDIGQGGIRFLSQEFIPKNSLLKIRLIIEKIPFSFETYAKVVWVRQESRRGRYEIGVEFTNISTDAAKQLIAYLTNIAAGK
ncbi:MAG: PilZ domain-containing protein [Candidatus Omnitrophota bacterium]|jgi:c-di-GMP-binding flagellar brake protein YcgR